jgi:inner membrane protein
VAPETHLLARWIIAAKTTTNPRDCRLATLAGILPDADGLELIVDLLSGRLGCRETYLYERYHHYLLHGALGGILITVLLTCFARLRWRVSE